MQKRIKNEKSIQIDKNRLKTYEELHVDKVDERLLKSIFYRKLFLIGGSLVGVLLITFILIYILYIANPKRVFINAYDNLGKEIVSKINLKKYDLNKNFTYNNKITVSSEIVGNEENKTDFDKLILNLNNIVQDVNINNNKNKKMLVKYNASIADSNLFSLKMLQDKNITYYYTSLLNKYLKNDYINYQSLLTSDLSNDELEYLENIIVNSFNNYISKEDFKKSKIKMEYNKKIINCKKIDYNIDNQKLINLLNYILSDIKQDNNALTIMKKINKNFENIKINSDIKFLKNQINISLYTTSGFYKPLKYEINSNFFRISYDNDNIELKYNSLYSKIKYKNNLLIFSDKDDNNIGRVQFSNNKIEGKFVSDDQIDFKIEKKVTKIKNGKNYNYILNINMNKNNLKYKIIVKSDETMQYNTSLISEKITKAYKYSELNSIDKSIIKSKKEEIKKILYS